MDRFRPLLWFCSVALPFIGGGLLFVAVVMKANRDLSYSNAGWFMPYVTRAAYGLAPLIVIYAALALMALAIVLAAVTPSIAGGILTVGVWYIFGLHWTADQAEGVQTRFEHHAAPYIMYAAGAALAVAIIRKWVIEPYANRREAAAIRQAMS